MAGGSKGDPGWIAFFFFASQRPSCPPPATCPLPPAVQQEGSGQAILEPRAERWEKTTKGPTLSADPFVCEERSLLLLRGLLLGRLLRGLLLLGSHGTVSWKGGVHPCRSPGGSVGHAGAPSARISWARNHGPTFVFETTPTSKKLSSRTLPVDPGAGSDRFRQAREVEIADLQRRHRDRSTGFRPCEPL